MKKTLRNALIALLICSSSAFAASTAAANTDGGMLVALFFGFFALIVVFQLIPAVMMFIGMIKALFRDKSVTHH